jgi:hypothetical protein
VYHFLDLKQNVCVLCASTIASPSNPDLSLVSSTFVSLPREIHVKIMSSLVNIFDKWRRRRNVYNLMQTCRELYAIGLPCLYAEVLIDDMADSSSFFLALPERGHLVRRLRIEERLRRLDDKRKAHDETFIPESLAVITQNCSNLRELFVGCRCLSCVDGFEEEADLEWFVGVNEWVQR